MLHKGQIYIKTGNLFISLLASFKHQAIIRREWSRQWFSTANSQTG